MVMGALERIEPPRILGDLSLLAALGEGGMATVYLAGVGSGPLARMCAVKLLRANLPDHDYRTRFLDEARLVVRLHHNNIVDVRAAGEIDGQLYIAMEAIEGRDLADVWDRCAEVGRAFPVPLAVHVCREVLRGLHYAHTFPGLGLVHRDVSPSNMLIDWAGAVRLADFGLATSSLKASLTLPGVVFGKVGYMSPEQARHEPLDGRADVYAVSVILWELLTGRPLRTPDGMTTDAVSKFEAPPPSSRSRRVDSGLDDIVTRGLARDRDDRWDSAKAMMLALNTWLAEHSPEMGQEKVAEFMRKLFGNAREIESAMRADLLRELTASQRVATGTQILDSQEDSATGTPERESRSSARIGPAPPGLDARELIDAGTVIADRYRVLSRLGRGGMGYVYLGEHVTVGRSVAIKVLTHDWSQTRSVAQRFRAEARAASAAGHPNIVEVFDAGELTDGRLYLVMEFLTGNNLYEEVQDNGPMAIPRACQVMRDVGRAIRAAHEVGIIHRDLKPDNVMLVDRGDEGVLVKVLDFGISSSAERNPEEKRLTNVGQALGTPEYMAPEQAKGADTNERFDMYALGVMFYELLTGDPPFHGNNVLEIITRKTTEDPPSVATRREGMPAVLVELVDDCIDRDPEARPGTAQIFLARLEDILRSLPRTSSEASSIAFEASMTRGRVPSGDLSAVGASSERIRVTSGAAVAAAVTAARDSSATESGGASASKTETLGAVEKKRPAGIVVNPVTLLGIMATLLVIVLGIYVSQQVGEGGDESAANTQTEAEAEAELTGREDAPLSDDTTGDDTTGGETSAGETADGTEAGAEDTDTGTDDTGGSAVPVAKHKTAACAKVRADAKAAESGFKWKQVLTLTKQRSCWASRNDRVALEVQALSEIGNFTKCAQVGKSHPSSKVKKIVALCKARAE